MRWVWEQWESTSLWCVWDVVYYENKRYFLSFYMKLVHCWWTFYSSFYFFFADVVTLGSAACNCDIPCTHYQYETTLSSSLLDAIKIRDEIKSHEKSRELLPRYQEALEVSAQVHILLLIIVVDWHFRSQN